MPYPVSVVVCETKMTIAVILVSFFFFLTNIFIENSEQKIRILISG